MLTAKRIESRKEECKAVLTNLPQARECDQTHTSLHLIVFGSMYDREVKHKRNSPSWSVWLSLATPVWIVSVRQETFTLFSFDFIPFFRSLVFL